MVKSKKWARITPQTKLKVGDEIVRMDLTFASIKKVEAINTSLLLIQIMQAIELRKLILKHYQSFIF